MSAVGDTPCTFAVPHEHILALEYTCHLRVTGAHTLIQPLEALALPVKEWPVIPAWPSGGLSCSCSRLVPTAS